MSEYRQDPVSRQWVIVGCDHRTSRPNEFVEATSRPRDLLCPFCAGRESETPHEVAAYRDSRGDWLVRVVPNKFPAVSAEGAAALAGALFAQQPATEALPGYGRHEVIIESARHVARLRDLTPQEAELAFTAYRDRLRAIKADGRFRYVQLFKNLGAGAGASLEHIHSQLLALPAVPEVIIRELASSEEHWREHGRSLWQDLIGAELAAGERVVAATARLVAFCPYASRFPYEVWVAPRLPQARFEAVEASEISELAQLMRDVTGRIECALDDTAYNYFLHTLPFDSPAHDHYHWHIEILPRLFKVGGFEWSTGCFINPYSPESAAAHLRRTKGPPRAEYRG